MRQSVQYLQATYLQHVVRSVIVPQVTWRRVLVGSVSALPTIGGWVAERGLWHRK